MFTGESVCPNYMRVAGYREVWGMVHEQEKIEDHRSQITE